jgi:hypothetical protein
MVTFEDRIPVDLVSGDDIPERYTCALGDLELLAFGGLLEDEEADSAPQE